MGRLCVLLHFPLGPFWFFSDVQNIWTYSYVYIAVNVLVYSFINCFKPSGLADSFYICISLYICIYTKLVEMQWRPSTSLYSNTNFNKNVHGYTYIHTHIKQAESGLNVSNLCSGATDSNFGWVTDYAEWVSSWFSSVQRKPGQYFEIFHGCFLPHFSHSSIVYHSTLCSLSYWYCL